LPDENGDVDNANYAVQWRWASTNARGIMTACIAHAIGDDDAKALYDVPHDAIYHTRLGTICVVHIIEDLHDILNRQGRLSWSQISTPGGYVPAQWQNMHFSFSPAWAMARAIALVDRSSPLLPRTMHPSDPPHHPSSSQGDAI
jgi:hypothetical protein